MTIKNDEVLAAALKELQIRIKRVDDTQQLLKHQVNEAKHQTDEVVRIYNQMGFATEIKDAWGKQLEIKA